MTEARKPAGRVFLIGAGPGDPELLTYRAARRIGAADAILIDDLVDRRVLAHKAAHARVIGVGKRGGCRSTPQSFITRLMIRLARAGATVARVKGGDPLVFGRGGEETIELRSAGIECEIVPGISSGLAAPAAAGIPVTHRGVAAAVTFVSGHLAGGSLPDWAALVRARSTLVIYMGVANLEPILAGLAQAGLPARMPAAAIERATWSDERIVRGSLGDLAARARQAGLRSPAIVVVGEAVGIADSIVEAPAIARVACA